MNSDASAQFIMNFVLFQVLSNMKLNSSFSVLVQELSSAYEVYNNF